MHRRALIVPALLLGTGLAVAGCSTNQPEPMNTVPTLTETVTPTPTETVTASPTETAVPSPTASENPVQMQTISKYEVTLDIPATWSMEEVCEQECSEYSQWDLKNADGTTVLILLPNTATSPDGDMNSYEREVLSSESIPGLTFQPASVVAHHAVGTNQENGEQTEYFSMSVIDDEHLADRGSEPDLDYFKTSDDAWPMLWVAEEYLEATGYREDDQVTREQAEAFVNSEDFEFLSSIMKTVRITE